MTVTLMNNTADPDEINKNPATVGNADGTVIKGTSSVDTPTLIIDTDILGFNYMHIPDWNRYYNVDSRIVTTGGRVIVQASSDPVYSFKDSILNLNVYVARSETDYNLALPDPELPLEAEPIYTVQMFGENTKSTEHFILGVI